MFVLGFPTRGSILLIMWESFVRFEKVSKLSTTVVKAFERIETINNYIIKYRTKIY